MRLDAVLCLYAKVFWYFCERVRFAPSFPERAIVRSIDAIVPLARADQTRPDQGLPLAATEAVSTVGCSRAGGWRVAASSSRGRSRPSQI